MGRAGTGPCAYFLLPTTHYLLLTTHYLLLTTYCLLLTAYCDLLFTYCLLLTAYCLLLTTCHLPLATCHVLLTAYYSLLTSLPLASYHLLLRVRRLGSATGLSQVRKGLLRHGEAPLRRALEANINDLHPTQLDLHYRRRQLEPHNAASQKKVGGAAEFFDAIRAGADNIKSAVANAQVLKYY